MNIVFAGPARPGLAEYLRSCGEVVRQAPRMDALPHSDEPFVVLCSAAALREGTPSHWPPGRTAMFVGEWKAAPADAVGPDIAFIPDELGDARVRELLVRLNERAQADLALAAAIGKADRMRRKFEEARAEIIRFSERVSHDLQSVLQNIEGFGRVLSERTAGRLDDKEAHYLERICAGATKGAGVVRDAAFMARAAWAPLERTEVDLARLVERCIAQLGVREGARRIRWDVGDLPKVRGDGATLQLAVWHLLDNALKFTRSRDVAQIAVRAVPSPDGVELQVRDNGIGFDAGYAQRLFEPFERLHSSADFEGNGVGLAFVRTIARRHGGDVRAELEPAGGALFAITLPAAAAVMPPAADSPAAQEPLRILLVDDDPLVLLTIKGMLERDGHSVTAASGAEVALQELQRRPGGIDLVISDWTMPHLGGEHVVRAVAAQYPKVAVFVLTGRRPEEVGADVPGVDRIIAKPVRLADMRAAIAELQVRERGAGARNLSQADPASSAPGPPGPADDTAS